MLDALGLARGSGRVEDEKRMLRVDEGRLAGVRLSLDRVIPPEVAPGAHRHLAARALVDEDALDRLAAAHGERLVHHGFQGYFFPAAKLPIGGEYPNRPPVDDAVLPALCRKTPSHHPMPLAASA